MVKPINEKISVISIYNHEKGVFRPYKLYWKKKLHPITKIGYHHKVREGKTLFHIFSVSNKQLAFRLKHDTETLHWYLEEISDGLAN